MTLSDTTVNPNNKAYNKNATYRSEAANLQNLYLFCAFYFAKMLKYLCLSFTETDVLSLDED
ncbi:hypothetical protein PENANT_c002G00331 [Penicillium antarcticum]|uniref:Uncharacterized protein n=1 Tax=Penicillium antarcticum TaxID=416450 RepID=A0A1V6QKZ7_9EURO|nr:hypothetical protein PENANT_c002G00331 [Penicillium antarcticum]